MIYKTPLGQKYWILREELSVNNCIAVCIHLLDIGAVVVETEWREIPQRGPFWQTIKLSNKTAPPHQEHFIGDLPSFWVLFLLRKTDPVTLSDSWKIKRNLSSMSIVKEDSHNQVSEKVGSRYP